MRLSCIIFNLNEDVDLTMIVIWKEQGLPAFYIQD